MEIYRKRIAFEANAEETFSGRNSSLKLIWDQPRNQSTNYQIRNIQNFLQPLQQLVHRRGEKNGKNTSQLTSKSGRVGGRTGSRDFRSKVAEDIVMFAAFQPSHHFVRFVLLQTGPQLPFF